MIQIVVSARGVEQVSCSVIPNIFIRNNSCDIASDCHGATYTTSIPLLARYGG